MNKLLFGLVLAIGMGVGNAQAPIQVPINPPTFLDTYGQEVIKVNTLFAKYLRTSCTAPGYVQLDKDMQAEYYVFKDLAKKIQTEEVGEIQQDVDFEVFVGLQDLLADSVKNHHNCEEEQKHSPTT